MRLKAIKGSFYRTMFEEGKGVMRPMEARIYAEHFAVYRLRGDSGDYVGSWHLDYIPSGDIMTIARTLKDCVAKIEALLELPVPWGASKSAVADYANAHPETQDSLTYALARTADLPLTLEQNARDNARPPDSPKGQRIDR